MIHSRQLAHAILQVGVEHDYTVLKLNNVRECKFKHLYII